MGDRGQIAREVRDPLIPDLQIRTHRQTDRHTDTGLRIRIQERNFFEKNRKNARKLVIIASLFKFLN